jgi:alpha-ketoglutarate-dependent 2,4-dichlorophenoxyacetate dioxygenase
MGQTFFAEVRGVDPGSQLDGTEYQAINEALLEHAVLRFPDQPLDDARQERFSKWFGPLEVSFEDPQLYTAYLSNLEQDGSIRDPQSRHSSFLRANQQWHSDSTIFQAPARISFLTAHAVPPVGGETQWADMRAAWEALPEARRQELDGLVLEHDFQNSRIKAGHKFDEEQRRRWPPIRHPLVRVHEETGCKALYVGSQATHVVGWPLEKGAALIAELIEFATQDCFIYTHTWRINDLVMWDNRRVNHRGLPWDEGKYPRDLRRTTVKGRVPTMQDGQPVNEYQWRESVRYATHNP